VKMSDDLSRKLKRYFEWGGPKREVTNFDMGLTIIIVIALFAIAATIAWLINYATGSRW
jgi:hypothetical protein